MTLLRAFLIWLCFAVPVGAQQQASLPVLVVDSERLFAETEYGQRIAQELEAEAAAVQAENDRIVQSLTEEERSLTVRRPQMTPEDFRAESDTFDQKVQDVRRVRDAKALELQARAAQAQAEFEQRVQAVLAAILIERRALVMLEQREVLISVSVANVTDEAIERINSELGDGAE